ncbi:spore germination protein GerPC [Paenibacillus sp. N4]|uniref:spore germination protein GerPC n=1 Tax=Paenibacillus vietnamensis TaxID=2590547 RepID=UPI001CD0CFCD|nr:spore germination protein GerPC [Paenibacillus vietnamensis]MCA0754550.1 spore germination protein GerPC [Paenibacillus vietnamensis]
MQQPKPMSPWQSWAYDVQRKLHEQQASIEKLEERISTLCEQIKQLEARPAYNIESIEYHFDQLKVESLEGTLNIGMTAPGTDGETFPGTIEQLSTATPATPAAPEVFPSSSPAIVPQTGPTADVTEEMNRYLDTEAVAKLKNYENEFGLPLDPYHERIIIEDIRKQMPSRVEYYINQQNKGQNGKTNGAEDGAIKDAVLAKTIRDTDAALLAYMNQLQTGKPASGGMA